MALLRIRLGDQEWTTDASFNRLLNVEVMALERATGLSFAEFAEALSRGSIAAITGIVWILRRRQEPGLAFDDVSFPLADLDTEVIEDPADEGKGEASEPDTAST